MDNITAPLIDEYEKGGKTIADVAKSFGISTGKAYYLMRDAGCQFNHKWKHPVTDEYREKMSIASKKRKPMTAEQRKAISERNSCNYNGLNGYGHTKCHNRGYVLAYVPRHPHAHKDGYVMLHTVIMERSIGRYLEENEVVHHINHDKKDNRIENLQLMKRSEHQSMHMKERHARRRSLSTILY